jgi:tetratricopeptide (TPR) repeat protein
LFKNVPFAAKKAEDHLKKTIELSKQLGLKNFSGMGYMQLGMLYKAKKRADRARECISESIHIFEECEAKFYLKQAREALESLSQGQNIDSQ